MKKKRELDRLFEEYKGNQSRMAEVFGVTRQAVNNWKRGISKPSIETAERIERIRPDFSAADLVLGR